jgi:hypothetical protein
LQRAGRGVADDNLAVGSGRSCGDLDVAEPFAGEGAAGSAASAASGSCAAAATRPPGLRAGATSAASAAAAPGPGVKSVVSAGALLPLVAFQLSEERPYDEFDIAAQLASERGWMVPAYTLPPNADHVKIMRALVKETLGRSLTTALGQDIGQACATLKQKGRVHETERKRVHTGTGY